MKKNILISLMIILSVLLVGCNTKNKKPDPDEEPVTISKSDVEKQIKETYTAYLESSHIAFKMTIRGDEESTVDLRYDIRSSILLAYTSTFKDSIYEVFIKDQTAYINDNNHKYKQPQTSSDFIRDYNFQTYTNAFYKEILEVFEKELTIKEKDSKIFLSSKDGETIIVSLNDGVKELTLRITKNDAIREVVLTFVGLGEDINFPSFDDYLDKEVS